MSNLLARMHASTGIDSFVSIIVCVMYSGICTMSGRSPLPLCRYLVMTSS